jgi:hypothetical protein
MRKGSEFLVVVEELMAVVFSFTRNSPGIFGYELRNLTDFEIIKERHTILALSVYEAGVCLG